MPIWYWALQLDQSIEAQLQPTDQTQFLAHDHPSLGFHAPSFQMQQLCPWIVTLKP